MKLKIKEITLSDGSKVYDLVLTGKIGCGHSGFHKIEVAFHTEDLFAAKLLKAAIDAYSGRITAQNTL